MDENKKAKILVVDDVEKNIKLLEAALTIGGFEVLKAKSGLEAVEIVESSRPDMVLLDIMMPNMDGFQTCEILRRDKKNNSIPIVMITAKDQESDIVKALERGADDYLIKPVSKNDLFDKINELLAKAETDSLPSQFYFKNVKKTSEEA